MAASTRPDVSRRPSPVGDTTRRCREKGVNTDIAYYDSTFVRAVYPARHFFTDS